MVDNEAARSSKKSDGMIFVMVMGNGNDEEVTIVFRLRMVRATGPWKVL